MNNSTPHHSVPSHSASSRPASSESASSSRSLLLGRWWLFGWLAVAALLLGRSLWVPQVEPQQLASAELTAGVTPTSFKTPALEPTKQKLAFRTIEALRVGDRVLSDNPDTETPTQTAVDPTTWKLVRLYAEERWPDGTLDTIHIQTLQSPAWLKLWGVKVGAEVPPPLDLVEMGLPEDLLVRVTALEPCPQLQAPLPGDDPGRLVLTTVNHLNNDVWLLTAEPVRGPPTADTLPHTLRPTGQHKFYSETRSDWVATRDLERGEIVQGRTGPLRVTHTQPLPGVQRVYNLTVEGEHVYYVGDLALLAHNTGCFIEDDPNIVFRALRPDENIAAGLRGRNPGAGTSIASHIMGKRQSDLVSLTRSRAKAEDIFDSGSGVVAIDLRKVTGEVIDVSSGVGRGRVYSRSKGHLEVLVRDQGGISAPIPAEAIVGFVKRPR